MAGKGEAMVSLGPAKLASAAHLLTWVTHGSSHRQHRWQLSTTVGLAHACRTSLGLAGTGMREVPVPAADSCRGVICSLAEYVGIRRAGDGRLDRAAAPAAENVRVGTSSDGHLCSAARPVAKNVVVLWPELRARHGLPRRRVVREDVAVGALGGVLHDGP
ncbi:hypothetical protein T492DRAFT_1049317 [Pavlovales sp. CCMP2436]|nr:hypothetical protein T492DRAFT_1049317 [Pavlovales sp. CCMP2436]|eukprot:CAMPEP_0179877058 /NCGR_PEP_ID=MMETSP0982-20121206/24596_1 /TAXON_ID=483367 /ORGANISM="non described non described, Strain CCMP 2436" /LENGTH=160 /DNA_ID=CAMNT_0021769649 /DNA_START=197 /DNA_END=679 /DNA_ORIENTATION=+